MEGFNRVFWMLIFLLGAGLIILLEWQGEAGSAMLWFMLTSLWSAICGISYTVIQWFIVEKKHRDSCS